MTKQKDLFYILQDVRFGELSEKEAILKLQELGVVIKVEKELPDNRFNQLLRYVAYSSADYYREYYGSKGYKEAQQDMLKAGYVAVESIKETKDGNVSNKRPG